MQKIVIDTNVFVSALIQRGYPNLILNELFISEKTKLCISENVVKEYYDVLNRKKFARYPDFIAKAEMLLADIEEKGTKYSPKTKVNLISDKGDNKFLELAAESKADFLITGNTNDFTMEKFRKTKIVSPKEYWEKYRPV